MPRQETILSVFVASPSDVKNERNNLEQIVRELNKTWSRNTGVRLELIKWETDVSPGIGTEPQDVINSQIGDDYDIFIGLMWHRFGSQTEKYQSGTEEEFENAYKKYSKDKKSVSILFYFKKEALPMEEINIDQLKKVKDFQEKLPDKGILYFEYKTKDEFDTMLRMHLSKQIQKFTNQDFLKNKSEQFQDEIDSEITGDTSDELNQENEIGFLELVDIMNDSFDQLRLVADRIGEATVEIGNKMDERTKEIEGYTMETDEGRHVFKRVISKAASDMRNYNKRLEAEIPIFSESLNKGIQSFDQVVIVHQDFDHDSEEIHEMKATIDNFLLTILSTMESMTGFKNSVDNMPRLQYDFNIEKKKTSSLLQTIINEMEKASNITSEIRNNYE